MKNNFDPITIINNYSYSDGSSIMERIKCADSSDVQELKDCFNEVTLWKINRRVGYKKKEEFERLLPELKTVIPNLTLNNFKNAESLLDRLLKVDGIRLPMASTYLHFLNEEVFPIIDQRAYREVYDNGVDQLRKYKEPTPSTKVKVYFDYIDACIKYCERINKEYSNKLSFKDIDKYLYQVDILKGRKVNY